MYLLCGEPYNFSLCIEVKLMELSYVRLELNQEMNLPGLLD